MIGNDEALRQQWFDYMREFFEVSDDGELKYYLGVHYQRDGGDVIATQTGYIERMLKRYGMENCKPASTPMPQKFTINPDELPERGTDADIEEMRSMLGSIIYCQTWSRPEISFAVNYLSRYTLRANKTTIAATRRILRYLSATRHHGIRFKYDP